MKLLTCSWQRAFSLLEMMIAAMVLFIAIMGVCATLLSIANLNAITKETNYAMNQARKIMEEVRVTKFDEILTTYNNKDVFVFGLSPQEADPDGQIGKISVSEVSANPELLEISVRLEWRGKAGNRNLLFRSRIAKTVEK